MQESDFQRGIDEFNRGEFYACHDTFEALWMEAAESERRFYQGILQVAVGCYHLQNANWRGAVTLLGEGTHRLRDYLPAHAGIEVASLRATSGQLLATLQQLAPEQVGELTAACQRGEVPLPQIVRTAARDA